jgi:hypothetical protein
MTKILSLSFLLYHSTLPNDYLVQILTDNKSLSNQIIYHHNESLEKSPKSASISFIYGEVAWLVPPWRIGLKCLLVLLFVL